MHEKKMCFLKWKTNFFIKTKSFICKVQVAFIMRHISTWWEQIGHRFPLIQSLSANSWEKSTRQRASICLEQDKKSDWVSHHQWVARRKRLSRSTESIQSSEQHTIMFTRFIDHVKQQHITTKPCASHTKLPEASMKPRMANPTHREGRKNK